LGGGRLAATVRRGGAAIRGYTRAVWSRDLGRLGGWSTLGTRLARVLTWSVRGVFVHRLSLQAAALAYYTLFSIVPVLVVALWALKLFNLIPYLKPDAPDPAAPVATGAQVHGANEFLREAVRAILAAVDRAGRLEAGIVGLGALLFGVVKQVLHVERALDTLAGARDRRPLYWRMLGYLALLALPPALLIVSGLLRVMSRLPLGATIARALTWLFTNVPLLGSTVAVAVGLAILSLALAIFYGSAARARIAFPSAMVGGVIGAVLLAAVLWAFARLQIGVSRAGALEAGMAAVPVFLLWAFSSWMVILIGAQVAVAHELDGTLIHGAARLRLEPYDEQVAGVRIMVEMARRALSLGDDAATADQLARKLRLLPEHVRAVGARLERAGLLRVSDAGRCRIACDPDRTSVRDVVGAVIGRPGDDRAVAAARRGPSLRALVERWN
jgi:membrane protein